VTDARTLAELFRVPPEQFTATRNRLVAELRRAGEAAAAAAITRLPRPTLVVWAINQAAQQDRAAVDRLLATADELKRAQLGRAPTEVPVAAKAYQDAVAALVEQSLAHVTSAGHAMTAAARNRLTGTLMAAATDPALRGLLREGRLAREQTAAGFEVFGDAPPALRVVKPSTASRLGSRQASPSSPPPEDRDAMRRRAEARVRLETARADLARAESRARELAKAQVELAKNAAEARQRAAAARRAAAQGRADVARARARVTATEKAIES
jgi:hypothetical protein